MTPLLNQIVLYGASLAAIGTTACILFTSSPVYAILYLVLSLFSVALMFWSLGAVFLAVLEILAVGIAFLVYARHAADGERVRLMGRALLVEQEVAGRLVCREFAREWVRVAPQEKSPNLIEVRGGGESVHIGRYLRPDLRPALAREISQALRGG